MANSDLQEVSSLPALVIDLDGTLVHTDTLHEAFLALLRTRPFSAVKALFAIPRGRAAFKHRVAELTPLECQHLPFNQELLSYLASQKGRRVILATGAPRKIADSVAAHCGLFETVLCSEDGINLTGRNKAAAISRYLNSGAYIYAGNSKADFAVWAEAEGALVVNASAAIRAQVQKAGIKVAKEFPRSASPVRLLFRKPAISALSPKAKAKN